MQDARIPDRSACDMEPLEPRLCLSSPGHHHAIAAHRAHRAHHHSSAGNIGVNASVLALTTAGSIDSTNIADRILFANSSLFAETSLLENNIGMIPPIAGSSLFGIVPISTMIPPVTTILVPPVTTILIPPVTTILIPPVTAIVIPPVTAMV